MLDAGCKVEGTPAGATGAGTSFGGDAGIVSPTVGCGILAEAEGGAGDGAATDGEGVAGVRGAGRAVSMDREGGATGVRSPGLAVSMDEEDVAGVRSAGLAVSMGGDFSACEGLSAAGGVGASMIRTPRELLSSWSVWL